MTMPSVAHSPEGGDAGAGFPALRPSWFALGVPNRVEQGTLEHFSRGSSKGGNETPGGGVINPEKAKDLSKPAVVVLGQAHPLRQVRGRREEGILAGVVP
jgi:mono/diheme cytochrome c family protein